MIAFLKELAVAAGTAAVRELVKLIAPKPEPEPPGGELPHPTWKDVEHMRAQERSAVAHKVPPEVKARRGPPAS